MSSAEFNFNAMFEDPSHGAFGCVLFDFKDDGEGKSSPAIGAGWASLAGAKAVRIKSPADLSRSAIWLTNINRQEFWRGGGLRHPHLRESSYLHTNLGQLMRETGIVTKRVTTAGACEQMSEIFARSMSLAMAHYDVDKLSELQWVDEARPRLAPMDLPLGMEIDEALQRSFLEFVGCSTPRVEGGKLVILRRPRLAHAKTILESAIPQGEWEFIAPNQLPDEHARFDWLWQMQRPVLVKVAIKGFGDRCPPHIPQLLQMGEVWVAKGPKKERTWMTLQEARYFGRYVKLEIQCAFIADGWMVFPGAKKILEMGEMSNFSISLGLLAESHWTSLASRSRNPQNKKVLVSPRASWFGATDRFLCFASASALAAQGFSVVSYGRGEVSVSTRPDDLKRLALAAAECGLSAPAVLFDEHLHDKET